MRPTASPAITDIDWPKSAKAWCVAPYRCSRSWPALGWTLQETSLGPQATQHALVLRKHADM